MAAAPAADGGPSNDAAPEPEFIVKRVAAAPAATAPAAAPEAALDWSAEVTLRAAD